jgi:hypothetical protein
VEVCGVDVPDGPGTHRDEELLTTEVTRPSPQLVACDTPRWSIDTTFQACREDVKRESTQGDRQPTV